MCLLSIEASCCLVSWLAGLILLLTYEWQTAVQNTSATLSGLARSTDKLELHSRYPEATIHSHGMGHGTYAYPSCVMSCSSTAN